MIRPLPKFIHTLYNLKQSTLSLMGGKTVGARALVFRGDEVLLIRHTYLEGWCSIGGGIDYKESPRQCLARELLEEAGIQLTGAPTLMGVYHSRHHKRDDYVVFYIVKDFIEKEIVPSPEIEEIRWFKLNYLPKNITPGTARRLEEYLGKRTITDIW